MARARVVKRRARHAGSRRGFGGLLVLAVLAPTRPAVGQAVRGPAQPEVRADFIGARARSAHLGLGFSMPASTYVRLGVVGAAGPAWSDGSARFAGRVEALARFVFDPLRESRWAPYASGGLGGITDGSRWRPVLVGLLGVEGPAAGGLVPALEVGFGGGARIGLAFRRAMPGRR